MMSFRTKSPIAILLAGLIAVGLSGCNKGEEQAKAQEAQREAQAKAAEAQREADEKKAEAAREAAQVSAKAEAARVDARAAIQKDIAAADRKAADLKERVAKAKGNAKLNAQAAATEFDKRRGVVERDLEQLNTARGEAWDKVKEQTERDVDAVEAAVDSFDRALPSK
jgi:colicin import membrane protein